jgi:hypothetical protein
LAARCNEFYQEIKNQTLVKLDFEPEAFALFLEFVYCDRVSISKELAQDILAISKYFKVTLCGVTIKLLDDKTFSDLLE